MIPTEQQRFDFVYKQHLTNLKLQGKRPATINGYSLAVRRIADRFDLCQLEKWQFRVRSVNDFWTKTL